MNVDEEPADWTTLYERQQELKRPIDAAYRAAVAPMQRRRDEDHAKTEREYREKFQTAKARLYHAQQEFKETSRVLARWRDATTAAIDRQFVNEKQPALEERKAQLRPINDWYSRQWNRLDELKRQETGSS